MCAADCKRHNKEHSDLISGSLLDELSPILGQGFPCYPHVLEVTEMLPEAESVSGKVGGV